MDWESQGTDVEAQDTHFLTRIWMWKPRIRVFWPRYGLVGIGYGFAMQDMERAAWDMEGDGQDMPAQVEICIYACEI